MKWRKHLRLHFFTSSAAAVCLQIHFFQMMSLQTHLGATAFSGGGGGGGEREVGGSRGE